MNNDRCPTCGGAYIYWTPQRIIETIQSFNEEHGRPPFSCEWRRGGTYHPPASTVCERFGSFQKGVAAAGLMPVDGRKFWTQERIAEAIQDVAVKHGWPGYREADRLGLPMSAIRREFGSWQAAMRFAGRASLRRTCSGCGVSTSDSTVGCRQCQRRDSWRRSFHQTIEEKRSAA